MTSRAYPDGVVGILPFHAKLPTDLKKMPLSSLEWPLWRPDNYQSGVVGDMTDRDHLIIMPSTRVWLSRLSALSVKISLAIPEPRGYHGRHYRLASLFYRKFHRILTSDPELMRSVPNGLFVLFGTTWVPDWEALDLTKDRNLSLIASKKRSLPGHKLRHKSVDWIRAEGISADIMRRGYKPFTFKSEGLARYRFSVVIENCREKNYFTVKLIDALLCRIVPIYWGCPNVADFFDTDGMIVCETFEDLKAAIRSADVEMYRQKMDAVLANIPNAAYYGDYYGRIAQSLLTDC